MSDLAAMTLARVTRLALLAQRLSWPAPRFVRAAGRRLLSRFGDDEQLVQDWSSPLILRESAGKRALPGPLPRPISRAASIFAKAPDLTSRPFRCLLATGVLDAGGMDEFVAFLTRRLAARGVAASVVVTDRGAGGGQLAKCLRDEGFEVFHDSIASTRRWLAKNRPDVISAHGPPDWLLEAAAGLRIPVVETLHGVPTPMATDWTREGLRSRGIHRFVAVSDLVRRQYLRGNPAFDPEAVVTIPNGYNDSHRHTIDRAAARNWLGLEDEFLFLSLGRHVMQKNAFGLVSAFIEVARANPRAHLLIAGRMDDGIYMRHVAELRRRSPATERIHLRSNLADPSVLLSAADCCVMNPFFEGWPLASMEALCAGLPTIMSDVGGAREQLADGRFGFLVPNPAGDPETVDWDMAARARFAPQRNKQALVAAMNAVIADQDTWRLSREARAKDAVSRLDARKCVDRYVELLGRAAAGAR
ncbi:glycosyltransferase involved in cell wall biosynthesis [Rhodoblastus acidophilus]|uniref:glycosyltransferase family 4 protein n=1 Tax=Rhodoblastus acidophilus TaxID=1074 RepID=UPI0022250008|nr:glycosyltransferase family 4 protein [Rhodoblastus acidophilus]MCW2283325.1 glycosyltransferase involved in cell wall biosynthesis [Rhodoblastus acidophilus]MCW2332351.1 glycosyltransferase involved in cell wall biosynthesis [Rhodoblastus acidophilus]